MLRVMWLRCNMLSNRNERTTIGWRERPNYEVGETIMSIKTILLCDHCNTEITDKIKAFAIVFSESISGEQYVKVCQLTNKKIEKHVCSQDCAIEILKSWMRKIQEKNLVINSSYEINEVTQDTTQLDQQCEEYHIRLGGQYNVMQDKR
jgi:hypothetical protein